MITTSIKRAQQQNIIMIANPIVHSTTEDEKKIEKECYRPLPSVLTGIFFFLFKKKKSR